MCKCIKVKNKRRKKPLNSLTEQQFKSRSNRAESVATVDSNVNVKTVSRQHRFFFSLLLSESPLKYKATKVNENKK